MQPHVDDYRRKRDFCRRAVGDYEIVRPGGAFYSFPAPPWGTASEFVTEAIENQLLIIPGNIFSRADTHFRISYAASDRTLERGRGSAEKACAAPLTHAPSAGRSRLPLSPRAASRGCFAPRPEHLDRRQRRTDAARHERRLRRPRGPRRAKTKRMPRDPSRFGPSVLGADNQQRRLNGVD